MTEAQVRAVLICIALFMVASIAAMALGGIAVDVVLVVGLLWLVWDRTTVHERTDEAIDDADKAVRRIEAVENHLTGLEPPSTGRHADGKERLYERPSPRPRAVRP